MTTIEAIDIMLDYYQNHYGDIEWIRKNLGKLFNRCPFCEIAKVKYYYASKLLTLIKQLSMCRFCLWLKYMNKSCGEYAESEFASDGVINLKLNDESIPEQTRKEWRRTRIRQLRQWRKKELKELEEKNK